MKTNQERGFTLVELLVVMVIIGFLIAIGLFGMGIARRGARDTARKTDLQAMQLLLEEFFNRQRYYPSPTAEVTLEVTGGSGSSARYKVGANTFTTDLKAAQTYNGITSGGCPTAATLGTVTAGTNEICYYRGSGQSYQLRTYLEAGGYFELSSK